MEIDFGSAIVIQELITWMDGGSVTLICKDSNNQKFEIEFVQNVIWAIPEHHKFPGRIYLNGKLVDQRSDQEHSIVMSLENSSFENPQGLDQEILEEKLNYVKSETYLNDTKNTKLYHIKRNKEI